MEIWKDVKGYEGFYQVSSLGRVKSLVRIGRKKEKILIGGKTPNGYLIASLCKNGKTTYKAKHQLVAIAFLNHVPNKTKLSVNHINFIRTDNRLENLEVVTIRENANKKHLKSTSKYIGVNWKKSHKKWVATIHLNKKQKYLGLFKNEIEAHTAYQEALKHYKDSKRNNFKTI